MLCKLLHRYCVTHCKITLTQCVCDNSAREMAVLKLAIVYRKRILNSEQLKVIVIKVNFVICTCVVYIHVQCILK